MTKPLAFLLRAVMALIFALCLSARLDATPALITTANFPAPPPSQPVAGLVSDGAGNFWGTSYAGGAYNYGTVFKKNISTGVVTKVVDFANTTSGNNRGSQPLAALVKDSSGNFWGTTSGGGSNGAGTIFKVNISTGAITTVVDFANATSGGNRGANPQAAMISDGSGYFWGTTVGGGSHANGTIFKVNASSGSISTLVDFANTTSGGNRGGSPQAALLRDSSGNFWGTTYGGGSHGYGTMFEYTSTGTMTTVVDFDGSASGNYRGGNPFAGLASDGAGNLWGTTYQGGAGGFGTLFRYTPSTSTMFTNFDFVGAAGSRADLASDGAGNLWGTTVGGGTSGGGQIFKLNPSTYTLSVWASLNPYPLPVETGSGPAGALVSDGAGNMWGTTQYTWGPTILQSGTIFKINTSTSAVTGSVLSFTDGNRPLSGLVSDSSGNLWGTTLFGGATDNGTVYKMNPSTGVITTVVSFAYTNVTTGSNRGSQPWAGLVSDGAGYFWGTTSAGGANGKGTVFKINVSSGAITTVADFSATVGSVPYAALVSDGAGNLWGTTSAGGANNKGAVFSINMSTGVITTVVSFASTTTGNNRGGTPTGALVSDGAGNFWGTTSGGGANSKGTVFEINISTGAITTVVDFTSTTTGSARGGAPGSALASDGFGYLWGTTPSGGSVNKGTLFKVDTSTGSITTMSDFAVSPVAAPPMNDGLGNMWFTISSPNGSSNGGSIYGVNAQTGATVTSFNLVAGTNLTGSNYLPIISLATPGRLYGTTNIGGTGGTGTIFCVYLGPVSAPSTAGSITSTGATISGSANPVGISTEVFVQYGTTASYGSQTSFVYLGNGNTSVPFNMTLSGLSPGTTYHYRLMYYAYTSTGSYGYFYGPDQTFALGNSTGNPLYIPVTNLVVPPTNSAAPLVSDGAGNLWGTASGGFVNYGSVFKVNMSTGAVTSVVSFANNGIADNRGANPSGPLVSDAAGNFWGTTTGGGSGSAGTVFKVNASTGAITTVADFAGGTTGGNRGSYPWCGLLSDGAGNFWGTTYTGGANSAGTVFKIDASTGVISTVVDFANTTTGNNRGGSPQGELVSDGVGNFWGTTHSGGLYGAGTVYEVNVSTGAITTVVDFANGGMGNDRGGGPYAALVNDGAGNLWGTTLVGGLNGDGTIFRIDISTGGITTVSDLSVSTDPTQPAAPLVSDGAGNFLGTGTYGGANGVGGVFKVYAATGGVATVVDFAGTAPVSNRGSRPAGALVSDGAGNFWGTTALDGAYGGGTVFKIDATTGVITTVADLGLPPPLFPYAGLVDDGTGILWGTTSGGGANSAGTVFKVDPATGAVTTVVDFANTTTGNNRGGNPSAALISDGAGNFWGTTQIGGANSVGTVFEVNASTGVISTVVDFTGGTTGGDRGASPDAALVSDGAGNLWGTTQSGGVNGVGTVFEVNVSTGAITTVVDFANATTGGNRGATPDGALVSDGAGNLWGTTVGGGASSYGTVFEINASTGVISTLVDFASTTTGNNRGGNPTTALVSDGAGSFWGTTMGGGASAYGTVFKVNASTGAITTLADFANTTTGNNRGSAPDAALVSDGAGNFWGTTSGGGANGYGTIFKINVSTGALTTAFDFTGPYGSVPGATPYGTFLATPAGFYGTTSAGGRGGGGEVFFIDIGPQFSVSAGSITSSGATVSGSANPQGVATGVYIQYGTTTSYGSSTGSTSLGSGTSLVPFSIALSGLSARTAYHYRLVFTTASGNFYSPDQTFSTGN